MSLPESMRAARITAHGGPEVLEVVEVAVPKPGPGEVLVQVAAAGVNNTDLWTRRGSYGVPGDPDAKAGWRGSVDFPRIQGADAAGRVAAVGEGVDDGLLGRRVLVDPSLYGSDDPDANPIGLLGSEADGGYAEFLVVPASRVHDVHDSALTDVELAALPTAYGSAMGMIARGGLGAGDTALVTGASGGVGLAAVQLAKERGARVIAVCSAAKFDAVREAGADEVLDRAGDVVAAVRQAAPDGVDVVLDAIGGRFVGDGLPLLVEGGRWVLAGALAGHALEIDARHVYLRNVAIIGSAMHTPAIFAELVEVIRRGRLRPVISGTFRLEEAVQAQEQLGERNHIGKLVLEL
ncbi:MAG: zinc-binding dehydrogenase [Gordonia sp. (in: high G+C Gram-positive bacteria)]|uniref:zinc-binding dehydrogenase n=1 Tax=Gordonia sp. (in: high G+C Gram-positive bacteria) TaxID=84139 RepID=UPI0039E62BB9